MATFDTYDPLSFMMILLFVYFVLILFIFMLIYNNIHGSKKELKNALTGINYCSSESDASTGTTNPNCIPRPTQLLASKKW